MGKRRRDLDRELRRRKRERRREAKERDAAYKPASVRYVRRAYEWNDEDLGGLLEFTTVEAAESGEELG